MLEHEQVLNPLSQLIKIGLAFGLHGYIFFCIFLYGRYHHHLSFSSIIVVVRKRSLVNVKISFILEYNPLYFELLVKKSSEGQALFKGATVVGIISCVLLICLGWHLLNK